MSDPVLTHYGLLRPVEQVLVVQPDLQSETVPHKQNQAFALVADKLKLEQNKEVGRLCWCTKEFHNNL